MLDMLKEAFHIIEARAKEVPQEKPQGHVEGLTWERDRAKATTQIATAGFNFVTLANNYEKGPRVAWEMIRVWAAKMKTEYPHLDSPPSIFSSMIEMATVFEKRFV